jgi:uncharacterized protein YgiM (DUF1202 family)
MAAKKTFAVSVNPDKAGLNLRAKPSLEAPVIRLLKNGEKVVIVPEEEAPEGWVAVKGGGYVMSEFLK